MITGSGLIANALRDTFDNDETVILFARGVSNSSCEDNAAYERELAMIHSFSSIAKDKIFVYFSTTSVFDEEKQHTKYVQEKKKFEKIIASTFAKSIIVRLPIIVGKSNNENQFFGYLLRAIKNGEQINVHKYASRYLIDVADLSKIVTYIIEYYNDKLVSGNFTIDVCGDYPTPVDNIITMLAKAIGVQPDLKIIASGSTYIIDNKIVRSIVDEQILNKDYSSVFEKYYQ